MEVLLPNCAGMDVHQKTIVVCALTTDTLGNVQSEVRTFGTLTKNLFELLKWLESKSITHIAMESLGQSATNQECPRQKNRHERCGLDRSVTALRVDRSELRTRRGYPRFT